MMRWNLVIICVFSLTIPTMRRRDPREERTLMRSDDSVENSHFSNLAVEFMLE